MTKMCLMCDAHMGIFSRGQVCKTCIPFFTEWICLKENILTLQSMTDEQLRGLKKFNTIPLCKLYDQLYHNFESDKELTENELSVLQKIQDKLHLTNADIGCVDKILPYVYANQLKRTGVLPVIDPSNSIGQ